MKAIEGLVPFVTVIPVPEVRLAAPLLYRQKVERVACPFNTLCEIDAEKVVLPSLVILAVLFDGVVVIVVVDAFGVNVAYRLSAAVCPEGELITVPV